MYWVVSKMVVPYAASPRMMSRIVRLLRGSRPVVGSSRKITLGPAASTPFGQQVEIGHQHQVLAAGEVAVDGGELAGDADRAPDRLRVPGGVVAGDAYLPGVGPDRQAGYIPALEPAEAGVRVGGGAV
jgi:hypothetical protein